MVFNKIKNSSKFELKKNKVVIKWKRYRKEKEKMDSEKVGWHLLDGGYRYIYILLSREF